MVKSDKNNPMLGKAMWCRMVGHLLCKSNLLPALEAPSSTSVENLLPLQLLAFTTILSWEASCTVSRPSQEATNHLLLMFHHSPSLLHKLAIFHFHSVDYSFSPPLLLLKPLSCSRFQQFCCVSLSPCHWMLYGGGWMLPLVAFHLWRCKFYLPLISQCPNIIQIFL